MKIIKTASGKKIVQLSKRDWENFGKKAKWLDQNGKLTVQAQEDLVREAQPIAPAKPKEKEAPTKRRTPDKPQKKDPWKPNVPVTPGQPKAKKEDSKKEDSKKEDIEVSPDNLPTIASELGRLKKKVTTKVSKNISSPKVSFLAKLSSNYEDIVPKSLIKFWDNIPDKNDMRHSRAISQFGGKLAKENFDYLFEKMSKKKTIYDAKTGREIEKNPEIFDYKNGKMVESNDPSKLVPSLEDCQIEIATLIRKIKEFEVNNEDKLIQAAKDAVTKIFGDLPQNIIDAKIMKKMGNFEEREEPKGEKQDEAKQNIMDLEDAIPEGNQAVREINMEKEVGKRILMNTMIHGSSLHVMNSVSHIEVANEIINKINPELVSMYDRFSLLTSYAFFYVSDERMQMLKEHMKKLPPQVVKQMLNQMGAKLGIKNFDEMFSDMQSLEDAGIGWSKVEKDEGGNLKIKAKGVNFPALCQEVFKGAMEILSLNGYEGYSKEQITEILKQADKIEHEKNIELIGPSLWRKFYNSIPKNANGENEINLSRIMQQFSKEDPDRINDIISDVMESPEKAKEIFMSYGEDVEESLEEEGLEEEINLPEKNMLDEFAPIEHEDLDDMDEETRKREISDMMDKPKPNIPKEFDDYGSQIKMREDVSNLIGKPRIEHPSVDMEDDKPEWMKWIQN